MTPIVEATRAIAELKSLGIPLGLVVANMVLPDEALHCGLAHLQAAEFLYETRLFPEHEYTFKHALTQQAAYQSLLRSTRQQLHGQIARVLETHFAATAEHRINAEQRRQIDGAQEVVGKQAGVEDGVRDAVKLREILDLYSIANRFEIYPGTHTSKVADRFQNHVLKFFGESLSFEPRRQ